jgi:peptidoglycan/LPS O-acetylase OafA/YrhL
LENSGLVVVWFLGILITLALSSETVKTKLSLPRVKCLLGLLLLVCLTATVFTVYVTFALTNQFYNVYLGLTLSLCVFLTVLLLNLGSLKSAAKLMQSKLSARVIAVGAGFSYTLFLTHYPLIIYLNGLDLQVNRFVMLLVIMLITNMFAFVISIFTEKKHRQLANAIKRTFGLP